MNKKERDLLNLIGLNIFVWTANIVCYWELPEWTCVPSIVIFFVMWAYLEFTKPTDNGEGDDEYDMDSAIDVWRAILWPLSMIGGGLLFYLSTR